MKGVKSSRRDFIRGITATTGLFAAGYPAILHSRSPNELLSHACIGTANMAWADLERIGSHKRTHITALCDVDSEYLERARKLHPDARIYRDWRELLAQEGDRIDSLNVSTPDHTHAAIVRAALSGGKNVYAQKPLCRTLADCRTLEALVKTRDVVTQLGTHIAANACDLQLVDLLQSGVIGRVKRVWLFSMTGGFTGGPRVWPLAEDPVPETLDWKLWLAHASSRPYAKKVYHPGLWRYWYDFGSSWLGDMGSHIFSPVWLGLGMGRMRPLEVCADVVDEGWGKEIRDRFWPRMCHVTWTYSGLPATGNRPFKVEWFDGVGDPRTSKYAAFLPPGFLWNIASKTHFKVLPQQGRVVEGEEGWIVSNHYKDTPDGLPAVVLKNGGSFASKPFAPQLKSHYHEYLDCCLDGGKARSRFEWSARLTESIVAGNMAQRNPGVALKMGELLKDDHSDIKGKEWIV